MIPLLSNGDVVPNIGRVLAHISGPGYRTYLITNKHGALTMMDASLVEFEDMQSQAGIDMSGPSRLDQRYHRRGL